MPPSEAVAVALPELDDCAVAELWSVAMASAMLEFSAVASALLSSDAFDIALLLLPASEVASLRLVAAAVALLGNGPVACADAVLEESDDELHTSPVRSELFCVPAQLAIWPKALPMHMQHENAQANSDGISRLARMRRIGDLFVRWLLLMMIRNKQLRTQHIWCCRVQ